MKGVWELCIIIATFYTSKVIPDKKFLFKIKQKKFIRLKYIL